MNFDRWWLKCVSCHLLCERINVCACVNVCRKRSEYEKVFCVSLCAIVRLARIRGTSIPDQFDIHQIAQDICSCVSRRQIVILSLIYRRITK